MAIGSNAVSGSGSGPGSASGSGSQGRIGLPPVVAEWPSTTRRMSADGAAGVSDTNTRMCSSAATSSAPEG